MAKSPEVYKALIKNRAKLDISDLINYVLETKQDGFEEALEEGNISPLKGVPPDEWCDVLERYQQSEAHDGDFAWLAMHSQGHVYCLAARAAHYL